MKLKAEPDAFTVIRVVKQDVRIVTGGDVKDFYGISSSILGGPFTSIAMMSLLLQPSTNV